MPQQPRTKTVYVIGFRLPENERCHDGYTNLRMETRYVDESDTQGNDNDSRELPKSA